ncbi:MAG: urea ABC transporter ATP-binding protein UrtD [Fibrobacterales bacterium]
MSLPQVDDNYTAAIHGADHYMVYLENLVMEFDGFRALNINSFGVYYNELRVVIGPNGAGKSTMCDAISGKTNVTSGKVFVAGGDITKKSDIEIARMGIGRKMQTPTVFDSLTVYQNMELALPRDRNVLQNLWSKESAEERDSILSILERVNLLEARDMQAKYLSHGQRQWLAISMLIVAKPKLLLVDEPAAGLTDHETELTAELLLELKGDHTIIVIEHDMDFVRSLNSTVTVLNEGKVLAEGMLDTLREDPRVVEAYLGR